MSAHLRSSMCRMLAPRFQGWGPHSSESSYTASTLGMCMSEETVGCSALWPLRKWRAELVRRMRIESLPSYLARALIISGTSERSRESQSGASSYGSMDYLLLMVATEPDALHIVSEGVLRLGGGSAHARRRCLWSESLRAEVMFSSEFARARR